MLATLLAAALWATSAAPDTAPKWAQVSVGNDHTCALDGIGRAFCWGSNHSAQLGARTPERCGIVGESGHRSCYPTASDTPVPAGGAMRFESISAGRSRTCGLANGGQAYCWGAEVPGATGTCLTGTRCSFLPLPYEPARRFRSIEVGSRVTCGVTVEGEALCTNVLRGDRWWDLRAMEPLRAGIRARDVDGFADWPTENLCLVDERGAAWCRGSNRTAQLGTGAPPSTSREGVDSLGRVAGSVDFRRIVVQDGWMCGLDGGGRVHCWGLRSFREHYGENPSAPGCGRWACATEPVAVGGALRFRDVVAHHRGMCGVTTAGEAYCWAPTTAPHAADPAADYRFVRMHPELRFARLSGNPETGSGICGVTVAGELYCWDARNGEERRRILHPRRAR